MNDLISIVVPVYNVENYLEKCINTIIEQTYKNIEIILVDDGAKDNSGKICDKYEKEDNRIKVIHKMNGGLSDARNAGINIAKGKYIAFIDSDDFIDNEMIQILYKNLIETDSDISICGVNVIQDEKIQKENNKENKLEIVSKEQAYKNLYNNKALETVVAWNKLYKITLFDEIRYPKGKINEDAFIIHKLINKTNRIVYTSNKMYYYIKRKDSIMGRKFNIKRLDELEAFEKRMEFFKQNKMQELYEKTMYRYCASNRYCYINIEDIEVKKKLNKEFLNKCELLKGAQYLSKKEKIKMFILKNFIFVYKLNILLKG